MVFTYTACIGIVNLIVNHVKVTHTITISSNMVASVLGLYCLFILLSGLNTLYLIDSNQVAQVFNMTSNLFYTPMLSIPC